MYILGRLQLERNNCAIVPRDRYSLAVEKNGQRVSHVPKIAQNLFLRPQRLRVSTPAAEMSMSMVVTDVIVHLRADGR